jgi:hypothetical protein
VCEYCGEMLDERQYLRRYPEVARGDYVVGTAAPNGTPVFIDACAEEQVSPGRWLNHASDGTAACNVGNAAYWQTDELEPVVRLCMYTMRNVAAGEELCWDYGDAYWEARQQAPL